MNLRPTYQEALLKTCPLTRVGLDDFAASYLAPPGTIAAEIVQDLEAALSEFQELADALQGSAEGAPEPR